MKFNTSTFPLLLAGLLAAGGALAQGTPQQRSAAAAAPARTAPSFARVSGAVTLAEAPRLVRELSGDQADVEFVGQPAVADGLGMTHVTYEQTYRGVPVEAGRLTVHARGGRIETVTGQSTKIPADLDVTPALTNETALRSAVSGLAIQRPMWTRPNAIPGYSKPEGELTVFRHPKTGETKLAYKFDIYGAAPVYRAWVYTDANTGEVLFENSRIHHLDEVVPAESNYNGEVELTAGNRGDGTYVLEQTTTGGGVSTFSLNNTGDGAEFDYALATSVVSDGLPFATDPASVSAHYGAEQTYDYYFSTFGRRSFNDEDSALISYTHAAKGYVNAFWNGQFMTYGDGDGEDYGPLTSIDVSAHEITHGVTEFSANLLYAFESGAINESFSDIFGEMIEYHATGTNDWLIGGDFVFGDTPPLRVMSDPKETGDPNTYEGENWVFDGFDQGGVHVNSGIQNYWFYLLAVGGEGTNDYDEAYSITGIGREKASAVAYRNLTVYLSENSTYIDARFGAIQSAVDLYGEGSAEAATVAAAWDAVGVDASDVPRTCTDAAEVVELEFSTDEFPEESSWVLSDTAGNVLYADAGPFDTFAVYRDTFDLPAGAYVFEMLDGYGDGLYSPGGYKLTSDGVRIAQGAIFGVRDATKLCTSPDFDPDRVAPTVPGDFVAKDITSNSFTLDWSPSFDSVGVAGYVITYFGADFLTVFAPGTEANFVSEADAEFTLGLYAFDEQGNRSEETFVTFRTLPLSDPVELLTGGFETGYDGWVPGGWDAYRYRGPLSPGGDYSMRLRDNSGFASSMFTYDTYDLSEYQNVELAFTFLGRSMEDGERFVVEYNDGDRTNNNLVGPAGPGFATLEAGDLSKARGGQTPQNNFGLGDIYDLFVGWEPIAVFTAGEDFTNDEFFVASALVLKDGEEPLSGKGRFRIRCDASSNNDQIYVDDVFLRADVRSRTSGATTNTVSLSEARPNAPALRLAPTDKPRQLIQHTEALSFGPKFAPANTNSATLGDDAELLAYVSPNPATNAIELELSREVAIERASLYSATGQLVREIAPEEYEGSIDVSAQAPGMYYMLLQLTEGETRTLRFVKQ